MKDPCEQCADNFPNPCGDHDPECVDVQAVQNRWARNWSSEVRRGTW